MLMKIGELAKRTGLTVRALHHYDEIGLLVPSIRSDAGYRLYNRLDVARLYRIQALRRLDLSLEEIQEILSGGAACLPDVIAQQISSLERQIQEATALRTHLVELQGQLESHEEPDIDDWLAVLEGMVHGTTYFTDEEREKLKAGRNASPGETDSIKAELGAALRSLVERGVPPDSLEARELAHRWIELLLEEACGDEGLLIKLYTMHWNEPTLHSLTGIDRSCMNYISHAMAHRRIDIYANYCHADDVARLRTHYVAQTAAWPSLIAAVREWMAQDAPADCAEVQDLARQWQALSLAKAGGSPLLAEKLRVAFESEPALRRGSGIDDTLMSYVGLAMKALEVGDPAATGTTQG